MTLSPLVELDGVAGREGVGWLGGVTEGVKQMQECSSTMATDNVYCLLGGGGNSAYNFMGTHTIAFQMMHK